MTMSKTAGCILGVDPGLGFTGYAVIDVQTPLPRVREAGVIRCPRSKSLEDRLLELHEGLSELWTSHPIQAVAIEQIYSHYERPTTAILMGHARGVLCLAAAQHRSPVHAYLPTHVKKMLTGSGRAPKAQMQHSVQVQLNLPKVPEPPDVADALAIALCHFFTQRNILLQEGSNA